jgi:hypothetical protein
VRRDGNELSPLGKIAYKPFGLAFGLVGGLLAGKIACRRRDQGARSSG